jgi:GntR family transcriptional regulator / MocR family aminotransferase
LSNHVSFKVPDGGMAVWTRFLKKDLNIISQKAIASGLVIKDGTEYNTEKIKFNAVRLGFASLNFKEQGKAIRILKDVCSADK